MVNGHEINANYIVSSLPYHKTQELIPHIEQIAEVKTLYKKIYGLLSVENYKHVDKMIIQDNSVIRCSSNKMNKNEEKNKKSVRSFFLNLFHDRNLKIETPKTIVLKNSAKFHKYYME